MRTVLFRLIRACIISILIITTVQTQAQVDSIPANIDKTIILHSSVLHEVRTVWIHLPEDYYNTTQTYPVLYLLDGNAHFKYVSQMVDYLSGYDRNRIPPMIVVAIVNVDRTRDFTPIHSLLFGGKVDSTLMATTGGGAAFLQFIQKEVISFVDSNYRVQPYRVLATHSLGGTFGVYVKEMQPDLFKSTILMSPAIYGGNAVILDRFKAFLIQHSQLTGKLFISIGNENRQTINTLESQLKQFAPKTFHFKVRQYKDENHFSVTYKSMYDALRFIYADWFIDNYDTTKFTIKDIRFHFDKLSKQFGYRINPTEDFMNHAGYKQLNAGNIEAAIEIFKQNTIYFPKSWNAFDSLGEAYLKRGDKQKAIENYQMSIDLNPGNEEGKKTLQKLKSDQN